MRCDCSIACVMSNLTCPCKPASFVPCTLAITPTHLVVAYVVCIRDDLPRPAHLTLDLLGKLPFETAIS